MKENSDRRMENEEFIIQCGVKGCERRMDNQDFVILSCGPIHISGNNL